MEKTAIIIILLLAAFLRLYHIDQYMTFLGDEGRDAIVMEGIITGKHFPLIGPGTSIGNMYLGPLYYYLAAPALGLAGFSPLGPALLVVFIGLLTVALIWWIGRQWFGRIPSLAVSALYALSPVAIIYSRSSWNPNIMPFFALVSMYGIWKVWRFGYWRWLTFSVISMAFVLNSHYLGLLLIPAQLLFIFLAAKREWPHRRRQIVRSAVTSLVLFGLLMSPLLFFDLRHGFNNLKSMNVFFTNRQTTVNAKIYKSLPNLWPIWTNLNISLITAKQSQAGLAVSVIVPLTLFFDWLRKRKLSPNLLFTLIWTAVGLVGLGLYKQHIYDHYYGFLFPVPFFLLGFCLSYLEHTRWLKIVSVILVTGLILINLVNSPLRSSPNRQLSRTRQVTEFIITQSAGQPFNLALIAKSNYDASYRYFLLRRKAPYRTLHQQITDQLFVICEPGGLPPDGCQPINHPLWEIAGFGWAKIANTWEFPWGVKLFKLVKNPSGA